MHANTDFMRRDTVGPSTQAVGSLMDDLVLNDADFSSFANESSSLLTPSSSVSNADQLQAKLQGLYAQEQNSRGPPTASHGMHGQVHRYGSGPYPGSSAMHMPSHP